MSSRVDSIMSNYGRYIDHIGALASSYTDLDPGSPVRLAKSTTNLFRTRPHAADGLDVSQLTHVLSIDGQVADVEAMCTYDDLVAVTLRHGLMPTVVPQLRTITVGGAVTGLGIESTSFRAGLPHEAVLDMDILDADGVIRLTEPSGERADLFRGFPNSYGSLGYATRVRLQLVPAPSFVHLRHVRCRSFADVAAAIADLTHTGSWEGESVDFLDGVAFSPTEIYLTIGHGVSLAEARRTGLTPSDYTGGHIYYQSIRQRREDLLRIDKYLWRWDTDWFWCSRAFGAQQRAIRALWPARYRRSDVYRRLITLDDAHHVSARIGRLAGRPPRERVVQDVEVPIERLDSFLTWYFSNVPLRPVWLCPLRLASPQPWPLYPLEPERTYVNLGFWGTVPKAPGGDGTETNREIEVQVSAHQGHKSLYSDAYYDPATFSSLYGGEEYRRLKEHYDPQGRFAALYDKVVGP